MGRRSRGRSAAGAGALVLVIVVALLPVRFADAQPGAVSERDEHLSVIVTLDPDATARGTARELDALGRRVTGALDANDIGSVERIEDVPALVVDVAPGAVDALAAQPGVVDVAPNRILRPLVEEGAHQMGADAAWTSGLAGEGTAIAIVDTGVDASHPMLSSRVVSEACFTPSKPGGGGYCPNGLTEQVGAGAATPCAGTIECGHGTHVAGTAAGAGDGHRGVAHDASIIAVQVFTSAANPIEGVGTDEASVIRALEWIYSQRDTRRIAAVNLSLGGEPIATPCTGSAALLGVLGRLDAAGIAVVASAGNDGSTTRLSFPACLPGVVSVGAVGRAGSVSSFSNSAASLTLLAPGQDIEGPWTQPLGYRVADGTSFASPHISGAIAVLRSSLPDWPVSSIVSLLRRTGDPARRGSSGEYLRANAVRLDRAIRPEFQVRNPAPLSAASPPIGALDAVSAAPGGVRTRGWALDGDTVAPATVHVYLDGAFAMTMPAADERADVGAAFSGWGPAHAYDVVVPAGAGTHTVCAYGIDVGPTVANALLGCRTITLSGAPVGALDLVAPTFGAVRVAGWAIDPDTSAPIDVHVYVDRGGAALRADQSRPDVAAAVPGYGDQHGFDRLVAASPGSHHVCAYAIDSANGRNTTLGCVTVAVPEPSPFGSLDLAQRVDDGIEISGWAADPDSLSSIDVHVYIDGRFGGVVTADGERLDVAAAQPSTGSTRGFGAVVAAPPTARRVCVYGINVAAGVNALIGCRTIA